jgi:hypothetical protein
MALSNRSIVAGLGVCALVGFAVGSWTSPFPPYEEHTDESTCTNEPCDRGCRMCCTHFNHPGTDPNGYEECHLHCNGLDPVCHVPIDV